MGQAGSGAAPSRYPFSDNERDMTGIASTVLIADDDADSRTIVRALLEFQGRDVLEASDGRQCLGAARALRPDVIVLDLIMPHMDGWEVAAALRADPATRSIPILALTAAALPDDRARALAAGCNRVLSKPIALGELAAVIDELFQLTMRPRVRAPLVPASRLAFKGYPPFPPRCRLN